MELTVRGVSYHIEMTEQDYAPVIVLLHGFTGSTDTWKRTVQHWPEYKVVVVDLIGHGKTESPLDASRYSMEQQLEDLEAIFEALQLPQFTLLGYSMGGRTALAYACEYPVRVQRLVLESSSPGLRDEQARRTRRESDAALAYSIIENGIEPFIDKWERIPLFESQKSLPYAFQQEVRNERLAQSTIGLANSLLGMGSGSQSSYWDCLLGLDMPVMLVTGELDPKFCAIAQEMNKRLPNAQHKLIYAGHAIHVEKPAEFATMVKELLN
ncbi:2-succinyl-6-hydroxy-2,4-cyclohexadiene-1-carboxylate synthase [Planococcus sp. ISL-109]|uniref:2-succinyl-6-hydroxy-2, 4-cyclohexadiene-1-carboxylate synthase n=1 Tax=Planococcus sp. ISL-109 TaxID=2819166 RepID=UPI001BE65269|nr:2-succinyl-6-hydroxy-2,4-cyclohexadiene-1-carboxylate synthase [Planococcus sp. ISL-109]MBT2582589.1 2-succinyl-6-hydroxy-2,4-cyclohexadiene-1-carboxylate synthase [Planococcus sp. ISL-109]